MKKRWTGCCAAALALCVALSGPGGVLASAADAVAQSQTVSTLSTQTSNGLNFTDVDGTGRYVRIRYTGTTPSGSGSLRFAIWSSRNGQDDLEWINGGQNEDGGYYVLLDTARHGGDVGIYHIHVYWLDSSGTMSMQVGTSYTIESIQHTQPLFVAAPNWNEKTAALSVSDYAMPSDGVQLKAAVWSNANGQDDLEWVNLTRSDNQYSATCNLLNHASSGVYYVHYYLQSKDGSMKMVGHTNFTVVGSAVADIAVENVNNSQGTCQIRMTGVNSPAGISRVQVAAWSRSDQSNIVWYDASSAGDGTYVVNFDLNRHQDDLGTYKVHVYVTNGNGLRQIKASTTVTFSAEPAKVTAQVNGANCTLRAENLVVPGGLRQVQFAVWSEVNGQDDIHWTTAAYQSSSHSASCTIPLSDYSGYGKYLVHVYGVNAAGNRSLLANTGFVVEQPQVDQVTVTTNQDSGSFRIVITGLENAGVTRVQVPVWSRSNQSDIIWYDAVGQSDGSYVVSSDISRHSDLMGEYTAHVYVTDQRGERSCAAGTKFTFQASVGEISIGNDAKETNCPIVVSDVHVPGGFAKLQAAVWSDANGQDDICWYDLTPNGDQYTGAIQIANHHTLGSYTVHIYAQKASGTRVLLGANYDLEINGTAQASIEVTKEDEVAGTFQVRVQVNQAVSGVSRVQIPVWCSADQSDIVWYDAQRQSDGSYVAQVQVTQHKAHLGNYQIHTYVTMGNGIRTFAGNTSYDFNPSGFFCVLNDSGTGTRHLLLKNAPAGTTRVQFPVWSNANGQDDIVWYEASKNAGGDWEAIVRSENHRDSGAFTAHCYINGSAYRGIQFNFPDGEFGTLGDRMVRQYARAIIQQTGGDLYQAFLWAVNNITYKTMEIPMNYPSGYTRQQYYFVNAYETRRGNCFSYAATFYWVAKEMGYDVSLIEGRVGMRAGGTGPHSWVEIRINGTTYICDPDAQYETGRNAYMVTYGSAPFTYYPNLAAY